MIRALFVLLLLFTQQHHHWRCHTVRADHQPVYCGQR